MVCGPDDEHQVSFIIPAGFRSIHLVSGGHDVHPKDEGVADAGVVVLCACSRTAGASRRAGQEQAEEEEDRGSGAAIWEAHMHGQEGLGLTRAAGDCGRWTDS